MKESQEIIKMIEKEKIDDIKEYHKIEKEKLNEDLGKMRGIIYILVIVVIVLIIKCCYYTADIKDLERYYQDKIKYIEAGGTSEDFDRELKEKYEWEMLR